MQRPSHVSSWGVSEAILLLVALWLAILRFSATHFFAFRKLGADFQEGDKDSNFSVFRVRQLIGMARTSSLNCLPVEIPTKPLIH